MPPEPVDIYKKFDALSPRHDLPTVPVRMRYLVLSNGRTGSSMVGSALWASGLAGVPFEYLNPDYMAPYMRGRPGLSLDGYMNDIVSRRTTPNGVFGFKLHHHQFMSIFRRDDQRAWIEDLLRGQDRFIFIRRRDKLLQAISGFHARSSKVWNSSVAARAGSQGRRFAEGDAEALTASLFRALAGEAGWLKAIATMSLPVLEIWYEDLVADYANQMQRVFDHLGLSIAPQDIPPPQTVKLANDMAKEMKADFLRYIGAGASRARE